MATYLHYLKQLEDITVHFSFVCVCSPQTRNHTHKLLQMKRQIVIMKSKTGSVNFSVADQDWLGVSCDKFGAHDLFS